MRVHFSIAFLLLIIWGRSAFAMEYALVAPETMSPAQQASVNELIGEIQRQQSGKAVQRLSASIAGGLRGDDLTLIAVGRDALTAILRGSGQLPIVSVYVSPTAYSELLRDYPKARLRQLTAIYSSSDPHRQLALAKILFGVDKINFIVMSSHSSDASLEELKEFAKRIGSHVQYLPARSSTTERDILRVVNGAGVILIDKDAILESQIDLGRLLLGSYVQYGTGVIGFGENFSAAGGLGSTYSTTTQLVGDLMATLQKYAITKTFVKPHFVEDFSVGVNAQLLSSLRLPMQSESAAQKAITQMLIDAGVEKVGQR